jgi:hypothetical protein
MDIKKGKQNYMEEKDGAPKSNVFTSGSPVANSDLGLIIQCLSLNNIFSKFYFPP